MPELYLPNSNLKEIKALLHEKAVREIEGLRLYEPMPMQRLFHESRARIRLARGSNRSGKSLVAAVEVARAATGMDAKFPKVDGRGFCVGKDLGHVGQVMWRKLGRAGAYKIIRDERTGLWRAFHPWDEYDVAYEEKARLAQPLIPPRAIKTIAWESKGESIPSIVVLHNGWELSFFSSLGKPPQGVDLDMVWLDEEVVDEDWLPEMQARVLDRKGRIIWAATPQAGTDQLYDLHERAEKLHEADDDNPAVEEFVILLEDNQHIGKEEKKELAEGLSDEQYRVRIGGDFAILGSKVYPEFSTMVHVADRMIDDKAFEDYSRNWTRYAAVDPGHQICAVLFAAVPPPEFGDFIYLYDEIYEPQCNADLFGKLMEGKCRGQVFQAFVIDAHMGIHTEVGIGKTISDQYGEALNNRKIRSAMTGSGFVLSKSMTTEDLRAGVMSVRDLLRSRGDGSTKLRILRDACPSLIWELKRYHRKRGPKGVGFLDLPDQKRHNHLCDCLRYMAMLGPRYVPRVVPKPPKSWAQKILDKDRKGDGVILRFGPRG